MGSNNLSYFSVQILGYIIERAQLVFDKSLGLVKLLTKDIYYDNAFIHPITAYDAESFVADKRKEIQAFVAVDMSRSAVLTRNIDYIYDSLELANKIPNDGSVHIKNQTIGNIAANLAELAIQNEKYNLLDQAFDLVNQISVDGDFGYNGDNHYLGFDNRNTRGSFTYVASKLSEAAVRTENFEYHEKAMSLIDRSSEYVFNTIISEILKIEDAKTAEKLLNEIIELAYSYGSSFVLESIAIELAMHKKWSKVREIIDNNPTFDGKAISLAAVLAASSECPLPVVPDKETLDSSFIYAPTWKRICARANLASQNN